MSHPATADSADGALRPTLHHAQYSSGKRKEHDPGAGQANHRRQINLPSKLYEEEKKNGAASKSGLVQKQQFQGEHDRDMQHVIKIYDRSNKHFYQQVNQISNCSNTVEEEDDFSGKNSSRLDAKQAEDDYS